MSSSSVPLPLVARGLTRRFHDGNHEIDVLQDLELALGEGESVSIVGESGVGKSTLLHLLGAIDRPDAGSVELDGQDLFSMTTSQLSRARSMSLAFVFQFHHLLSDFDAVENVAMPLLIAGENRARARKRATAMLERVGLGERLTHRPGELSGGEQQRVAVARAAVRRPRVILADEPTGNLDPETALDVQSMLLELQREAGCSLIVATHSQTLAAAMDRRMRLSGGVLHEEPRG
jgi:lipoprotein-releasing system ATP-binding protein